MISQRMLDEQIQPTPNEITKIVGKKSVLWNGLEEYLTEAYDFVPEIVFYGKKHGWIVRYRKSGRTLCTFFPEENAFTVLVVLGKKEVEKALSFLDKLNPEVRSIFENAKQLRDGRWLWIPVSGTNDVESIKALLKVKRKLKNFS